MRDQCIVSQTKGLFTVPSYVQNCTGYYQGTVTKEVHKDITKASRSSPLLHQWRKQQPRSTMGAPNIDFFLDPSSKPLKTNSSLSCFVFIFHSPSFHLHNNSCMENSAQLKVTLYLSFRLKKGATEGKTTYQGPHVRAYCPGDQQDPPSSSVLVKELKKCGVGMFRTHKSSKMKKKGDRRTQNHLLLWPM